MAEEKTDSSGMPTAALRQLTPVLIVEAHDSASEVIRATGCSAAPSVQRATTTTTTSSTTASTIDASRASRSVRC